MKNLIVSMVFILLVAHVKAQDTGTWAPKELTCTEKAFNVSFSIGQKLNLSAPKMGPLEAATYETDYMPAWTLKVNSIKPEPTSLPLSFQSKKFKAVGIPGYLFSAFNFGVATGYPVLANKQLKPFSFAPTNL